MEFENVALLVPIHPPKYDFMYNLINKMKLNKIHIDTYLVFSNEEDFNKFSMKDDVHKIICESTKTNSIVTYKKFIGLKHLANSKYEYIICCDGETDIIPNNFTNENINNKIKQIFDNKKIYAGNTDGIWVSRITEKSAELFPEKHSYLKDVTKNFTMYFWWSDLPVYRRADIIPFLDMIKLDNLVQDHFDYIVYQYYLILYHDFNIVDTTPITNLKWSLEYLNTNNVDIFNKLVEIGYGFSWTTKKLYNSNKDYIESQKGFIVYHLDRA
jgi:hypothetical protein